MSEELQRRIEELEAEVRDLERENERLETRGDKLESDLEDANVVIQKWREALSEIGRIADRV